jgi:cell division protein FtsW
MRTTARTDKSVLSAWWGSIDRLTVTLLMVLIVIGLMLVASASGAAAEHYHYPPFYFVHKQLIFLIPTLALMFGISFLDQKTLWRVASITLVITLLGMVYAIMFGTQIKGATRWITVMGDKVQPSEFAKPCFAIVSAWLMAWARQKPGFPGQQLALGVFLTVLCLLLMEPDLGMSVVLSFIWGVQVFLSGLPIFLIALLVGTAALGLFAAYMFFPHVTSRIDRFLDPAAGDNYQVQKSLDAFSHGGLFGTGPGHGLVKLTLPDAHEDFIFAVGGEEFGLLFAIMLIMIYCFIIIRSISRVYRSEDMFVILATAGLMAQFGLQSLIHMGSSLQLLPAKGMTLPLISYGGSSLLSFGLAMGALLALTRKGKSNNDI